MAVGLATLGPRFLSTKRGTMRVIENGNSGMSPEEFRIHTPDTRQEDLVNSVYASVDKAIVRERDRLRKEEGIIPTCQKGCFHCCRYHVLTNIAEAHTLAEYVKRVLPIDKINDLRIRTQQWHEWDNSRPGRYPSATVDEQSDTSNDDPCYCPLLVDGACIAYPVRPVVCRTHLVSSPPRLCRALIDPESAEEGPVVLMSVVTATSPISLAIRDDIQKAGMDFAQSQMLLPQWLAIEMNWDFAISP